MTRIAAVQRDLAKIRATGSQSQVGVSVTRHFYWAQRSWTARERNFPSAEKDASGFADAMRPTAHLQKRQPAASTCFGWFFSSWC